MDRWDWIWIGWLVFLVVMDIIADRKPGATFSEHCREWFKSSFGAVALAVFLVALYLHFIIGLSVLPVVVAGGVIAYLIRRSYVMFRWDKWVEGAVFSVLISGLGAGIMGALQDGSITGSEWWGLFVLAGGLFFGYCKNHPPSAWDGVDRRIPPTPPVN